MLFHFTALTRDGEERSGEIEAASESEAILRLQAEGLIPVRAARAPGPARRPPRAARLDAASRLAFLRELAALLEAGLDAERALRLMESHGGSAARGAAGRLRAGLLAGAPFSEAMAREGAAFPPGAVALVRAGERAGALAPFLSALVRLEEARAALADAVRGALAYPILVLCVAAAALVVLLGVVLPRFAAVFASLGRPIPPMTDVLLGIGAGLAAYGPAALALAGLAAAAALLGAREPRGRRRLERAALALPVFGPLARAVALNRLARALGALLEGGVPLSEALPLAAEAAGNGEIAAPFRAAAERVRAGLAFSAALAPEPGVPGLLRDFVRIGEETGRLGPLLERLASLYEEEARRRASRIAALVAPATTLGLGLLIGAIVLALVSSLMDIYDAVV